MVTSSAWKMCECIWRKSCFRSAEIECGVIYGETRLSHWPCLFQCVKLQWPLLSDCPLWHSLHTSSRNPCIPFSPSPSFFPQTYSKFLPDMICSFSETNQVIPVSMSWVIFPLPAWFFFKSFFKFYLAFSFIFWTVSSLSLFF